MSDISTNNWDVVNITDLETLNKIISNTQDGRAYPDKFDGQDVNDDLNLNISMFGSWGGWTVTSDASGAKVNMRCDITEGSFVFNDRSYDFNDGDNHSYIDIELSLTGMSASPADYVRPGDTVTSDTRCYRLMVDPDSPVTIEDVVCTNAKINEDTFLRGLLGTLMGEWFNNNIGEIKHVFSVILIGLQAENTDFQWMYPSAYSYAASSSIDKKTAGFGALTLVDDRTDTGALSQNIDVTALELMKPHGANLALIISKAMFVKHILMKAAVDIVDGSTEADFTVSETGLSLSNNREMVWQDFDDGQGGTYSPVLPEGGLVLTLESDFIHLSINGAHHRHGGMCTVYMGVEQNFRYKVEKNAQGQPVFVPDEEKTGAGDAHVSCSVVFDEWVNALELATGILASIATVFALGTGMAGAIAEGTALAADEAESTVTFSFKIWKFAFNLEKLAPMAVAIQNGVRACPTVFNVVKIASRVGFFVTGGIMAGTVIAKYIYEKDYSDIPSFHHLADIITGSSVWPGIAHTELKSATLADSFVIGLEMK